jgi:hypothetical protein
MEKMKLIPAKQLFIKFLLLAALYLLVPCVAITGLLSASSHAEVLDRVVAIVDDEVITLSEFNETYQKASYSGMEITREEVLDGMINRSLLLKQVKRFNIKYSTVVQTIEDENELINEYIERRLKPFIRIPFEEIELFYKRNKESFLSQRIPEDRENTKDLYDVRDEVETYLIEKELNKRLITHIEELRKEAYIKIQL